MLLYTYIAYLVQKKNMSGYVSCFRRARTACCRIPSCGALPAGCGVACWSLHGCGWVITYPTSVSNKANSHIPCRVSKSSDCVFPIWFTQCGRVSFTHAVLKATSQGHSTAWHLWISIGRRKKAWWRPARFGFFRPPRGDPRRLLSEA